MTRRAVAGTRGADLSGTERIGADRSGTERISAERSGTGGISTDRSGTGPISTERSGTGRIDLDRGAVRTSVHGGVRLHDRAGDEEAEGGIAAEAHLLRRLREREQGRGRDGSAS
jgi:hypothetical protein